MKSKPLRQRAEIFPAVLGMSAQQFQQRLAKLRKLGRPLHLDIMDGKFVATRSIGAAGLGKLRVPPEHEVHLMVRQPERWLPAVRRLRTKRVIIPVELGRSLAHSIQAYRDHGIAVAVSINPSTALSALGPWVGKVDRVHVMLVRPGRYGAKFQPRMLKRISKIRKQWPWLLISVDGGVNDMTVLALQKLGVDILVVGSALAWSRQPRRDLRRLEQLLG